jgi:uncharacterized membrane protein
MSHQSSEEPKKKEVNPTFRKWLRLLHIIFSLIWLGFIMSLGFLIFFSPEPSTGAELRYLNSIIHRLDVTVMAVTPLAALLTGVLLCWKTKWGFFRYWWVIVKLTLTIAVIVFSIVYLGPVSPNLIEISGKLGLDALTDKTYVSYFTRLTVFNPVNISLFLFMAYLSQFKPWGKRK